MAVDRAGSDDAQEHVTHGGARLVLVEQGVLAVALHGFEFPFGDIVIDWSPRHLEKAREARPAIRHVPQRLAETTVGLDQPLFELHVDPCAEPVHDGLALLLVVAKPSIRVESELVRLVFDPKDSRDGIEDEAALLGERWLDLDELAPAVGQAVR
jgi:hypothetical protein